MELRDLHPDDLDAALDVRTRSFGPVPASRHELWRHGNLRAMADRRVLGCYDGSRLVATAKINRFRQWWRGRTVPMAGVGGVVVAPEYRGKGVGRLLMQGVLDRAGDLGYPVSALYPATVPLYRGLGWEIAGAQYQVTVPTEALRGLATAPVAVRRVGPGDAAEILSVVRKAHTAARSSGPIDWDESDVESWLEDERPFTYLTEDGFLAYQWEGEALAVDELVAGSSATARALWSMVGSGSSVATTVTAHLGPNDPLRWLTREAVVQPARERRWMLRLVDVPAALAGRGYPAGVDVEVTLAVADPQRPANSGTWRLAVANAVGRVEPVTGRPAMLELGPRGIAALYAGTPVAMLRLAGLVSGGDPETDALLDTVFGDNPYLIDYF